MRNNYANKMSFDYMKESCPDVDAAISVLDTSIKEVTSKFRDALTEACARILELEQDNTSLEEQVSDLENEKEDLEREVGDLRKQIDRLTVEIDGLNDAISDDNLHLT